MIMKKIYMLLAFALLCNAVMAQQNMINKEKYTASKPVEDDMGYTHAVKAGNTLYISGTMATGTMAEQLKSIMETIGATLAKYGASYQNVVKENIYTTNLDSFKAVRNLRKAYYHNDYPASTWVEVQRLYLPQFSLAIDVVAVLPPNN